MLRSEIFSAFNLFEVIFRQLPNFTLLYVKLSQWVCKKANRSRHKAFHEITTCIASDDANPRGSSILFNIRTFTTYTIDGVSAVIRQKRSHVSKPCISIRYESYDVAYLISQEYRTGESFPNKACCMSHYQRCKAVAINIAIG